MAFSLLDGLRTDLAMQSVQRTSMEITSISKMLSVWVHVSSSSKQDVLFKTWIACGNDIDLMRLYCMASWQKRHGERNTISISLWRPNQKIASVMASQLNQQPAKPRPESFLQLCHPKKQLGHEVQPEQTISGSLLPPLAHADTQAASQTGDLINNFLVLSGTFSNETNFLIWQAKRKWEGETGERGGRLNWPSDNCSQLCWQDMLWDHTGRECALAHRPKMQCQDKSSLNSKVT